MTTVTETPKPTLGTIARAAGIALAVAAVVNIVLYFIATAFGWLPALTTMDQEITLVPVLIFTVAGAIVGAILYYILTRFLPYHRANQWFVGIASIVLIAMAITPITGVVDPSVGTVLVLEIMHLVVGLPVMYFLTKSTG